MNDEYIITAGEISHLLAERNKNNKERFEQIFPEIIRTFNKHIRNQIELGLGVPMFISDDILFGNKQFTHETRSMIWNRLSRVMGDAGIYLQDNISETPSHAKEYKLTLKR